LSTDNYFFYKKGTGLDYSNTDSPNMPQPLEKGKLLSIPD